MGALDFWNNSERAQKHIAKLNGLKRAIAGVVAFQKKLDDAAVMGIIGLIEGILYLTKSDDEFVATYVTGKKGWF